MNRRDFLKHSATLGVLFSVPLKSAWPNIDNTGKQFFITVNANGGWDPTSLCDPKGNIEYGEGRGYINRYYTDDIVTIANSPIQFAPLPNPTLLKEASTSQAPLQLSEDMPINNFTNFFNRHASNMMIINGIDVETVNHSVGSRNIWSGSQIEKTPGFGALAASTIAPDKLMSFLSYGGYDTTENIVPISRTNNTNIFQQLAYPNRPDVENAERHYFKPDIYQKIKLAKQQRLQRQIDTALNPQQRLSMSRLLATQPGSLISIINEMDRIKNTLPDQVFSQGLKGQAELAAAALSAGTTVCASLSLNGFDTHDNQDQRQSYQLVTLIDGVNHLWDMLETLNIADKTTIIIGSDFGRAPYYNNYQGKDHWNITSMILMGNGIPGNRVIGETTDNFNALRLDPITLEVAKNQDDPTSVKLTPAHIHIALRNHFSIADHGYSLDAPLLPFFN